MKIGFIDWFNDLPYSRQFVAMGIIMVIMGAMFLQFHDNKMYFLTGMVWFVAILTFSMARSCYKDEKNEAINGVNYDE